MKKKLEYLIIILSILLIFNVFTAKDSLASSDVDYITNANKPWTIEFSHPVKEDSIKDSSIQLVDEQQKSIPITKTVKGNKVIVTPVNSYLSGNTYTLIVKNDILSATTNEALVEGKQKKFALKQISKINKPTVYPSSKIAYGSYPNPFYLTVKLDDVNNQLAEYDENKNVSSVKLYKKVNATGKWEIAGQLFDSGNTSNHGDEIKGDGYYSVSLNDVVSTSSIGTQQLKVEVTLKDGSQLSEEVSVEIIDAILTDSVNEAVNSLEELTYNISDSFDTAPTVELVKDKMTEQLSQKADVANVKTEEDAIEVTYDSGVKVILDFFNEEEGNYYTADSASVANKVTDGDVLIWSPRASLYSEEYNRAETLKSYYQDATSLFNVDVAKGTYASLDKLANSSKYGTVIIDTKSYFGEWLSTSENLDINEGSQYLIEQTNNEMALVQNVYVYGDYVSLGIPSFVINEKWFEKNLIGNYDDSIIINTANGTANTSKYWNAFSNKGAGAYIGFSDITSSKFVNNAINSVVKNLTQNSKVKDAFDYNTVDTDGGNSSQLKALGNGEIAYDIKWDNVDSIVNGDFEQAVTSDNKVPGWDTSGDGRVLSSLGNLVYPTQGKQMGVISTGLGYTTSLGEISQVFMVGANADTLSFDWNYLSEEFLEFIGSNFDDPFSVILETLDGKSQDVILNLSVNSLADDFGATGAEEIYDEVTGEYYYLDYVGGNLVNVSPDIVFDQGDVWMTNWQTKQYQIPEHFKGKLVKLTFTAMDAVDTVLDTAVLIDNVKLK